MIDLSYSTFGLTALRFMDAIDVVDRAGYKGVELAFHREQFNPFNLTDGDLEDLAAHLGRLNVKPACIATASHFFTPSRPHEPSLMSLDLAGRKRRIDLVKRGIRVARKLAVPLVTFGSGFIREEHVLNPEINPRELLQDSIQQCLAEIHPGEDITLLIEPEPGMFIETMDDGINLIKEVNSPHFRLHVDICHAYCSDTNYIEALGEAAPFTRYLHLSDSCRGYNLKILSYEKKLKLDLEFAHYLIYFPEKADFLLVDREHPHYFADEKPDHQQKQIIDSILDSAGIHSRVVEIPYPDLYAGSTPFDDEIFTYLISIPGLSFEVLERAKPIAAFLRTARPPLDKPLVDKRLANTRTGNVHFHEIPGEGTLDFYESFKALNENGFSGFGSLELYHHIETWEKAVTESYQYLSKYIDAR